METQVIHNTEAVRKQEAQAKERSEIGQRHHVNALIDDDFWEEVENEKLQERDFKVESSKSMGSSHWCRLIPPAEQRSPPHVEHRFPPPSEQRSTQPAEYVGSQQTASIDRCYSDDDRYYTPTTISRPRLRSIDRHRLYADRYSSQTRPTVDWNQ